MDLSLGNIAGLVALTLRDPRGAARVILRVPLPLSGRWAALVLMAVLSAVLMQALQALLPPPVAPDGTTLTPVGPFFWAGMVAVGMVLTSLLVFAVGRWRGGRGELPDAVILIAWLQFIQLLVVAAQILLMIVLPAVAPVLEIAGVILFLWLLVNFVAEMHGFRSLGLVFLGVIITFVGFVFGMSLLLMILGVGF
ncbi:MAG: hypothetical protein RL216_3435 [Pseudomonadota bacterium]|jgi:hypothetical protein